MSNVFCKTRMKELTRFRRNLIPAVREMLELQKQLILDGGPNRDIETRDESGDGFHLLHLLAYLELAEQGKIERDPNVRTRKPWVMFRLCPPERSEIHEQVGYDS